jgi:hypothetical protein
VKSEAPDAIVTYANYPTTEYLRLPWLDLVCFNVYLESQQALADYAAHLQHLADHRPLILGELGLDSFRHGEEGQAYALDWQIRTAFTGGCAGTVVFSWTDEWFRSGANTSEWCFGLTDRDRKPKPALNAVREAFPRPVSAADGDEMAADLGNRLYAQWWSDHPRLPRRVTATRLPFRGSDRR